MIPFATAHAIIARMDNLSISVSTADTGRLFDEIGGHLIHHNSGLFGRMDILPLVLTMRDNAGRLRAGLAGKIFYHWLTIELLWVAEDLRGKGIGTSLLTKAEDEALARGCTDVWLDTIGTPALAFYQRNGYVIWGELPDYPRGHKRTFFKKPLKAA